MKRFKPMWQGRVSTSIDADLEQTESAISGPKPARKGPFQPDAFMPSQHFDRLRRRASPEEHLLIAMIADAVDCFQKHSQRGPKLGRREGYEAELWLMSSDRTWPFSFENVCDILQIEVEPFREGLLAWRERHLGGPRVVSSEIGQHAKRGARAA